MVCFFPVDVLWFSYVLCNSGSVCSAAGELHSEIQLFRPIPAIK